MMTLKEAEKLILEDQMSAIARAIVLIGKDKNITLNDITGALAGAERTARFLCGFEMLHNDENVKRDLLNRLIANELVSVDEKGRLSLTNIGRERSKIELPAEIERHL